MTAFELFFTTRIPDTLRLQSFSPPHLFLVGLVAVAVFWAVRGTARMTDEKRLQTLLICVWSLPCVYVVRFLVFAVLERFVEPQMSLFDRLPFHLCAMNAVIMPVAVVRRSKLLLNYMYAVAMPAAAAAMLTPAMSYYGQYFYFSWQNVFFFMDHALMVLVPVLCVSGGFFRPDIRILSRVLMCFLIYCAAIYPVNVLLNQNYLFLRYPDEGTVMAFFAKYLGNPGYLVPMAVLTGIITVSMYLPWVWLDRRNKRENTA